MLKFWSLKIFWKTAFFDTLWCFFCNFKCAVKKLIAEYKRICQILTILITKLVRFGKKFQIWRSLPIFSKLRYYWPNFVTGGSMVKKKYPNFGKFGKFWVENFHNMSKIPKFHSQKYQSFIVKILGIWQKLPNLASKAKFP